MFEYEGSVESSVNGVMLLIIAMSVAAIVITFAGALGGQTYNLVEDDISAISDTNIRTSVQNSISSGFEGLETTADYLPIVALAIMVGIVLSVLLGAFSGRGMSGGYGGGYAL